jgi:hypothetical protein
MQIGSSALETYLSPRDVCRGKHWPWGKTKLYALLKAGKLPRPRKIGGKNTYWTGSQVKAVQDAIERGEFDDSLGEAA